jgi:hypothetical protein
MGDQPVARPLPTQDNTNTGEARADIHVFEPTFPVFERTKTLLAAIVTGTGLYYMEYM